MGRTRYVALLRGINVGGRNKVPMADLHEAIEAVGHTDVTTYIQSGNVLFTSSRPRAEIEADSSRSSSAGSASPSSWWCARTRELRAIVEQAPKGFGKKPDTYHSDVIFLRAPLTPLRR